MLLFSELKGLPDAARPRLENNSKFSFLVLMEPDPCSEFIFVLAGIALQPDSIIIASIYIIHKCTSSTKVANAPLKQRTLNLNGFKQIRKFQSTTSRAELQRFNKNIHCSLQKT